MLGRDDLYDAINMFKNSSTGRGIKALSCHPPEIQARYMLFALRTVDILWQKYRLNEIGFGPLPPGSDGRSYKGWAGWFTPDIRIDARFRDTDDLGSTAITLAHEGSHFLTDSPGIEQEPIATTLEVMFFEDMKFGSGWFKSKKSGKNKCFLPML